MEQTYILYKDMYLNRYEWFGGIIPDAKVLKSREREASKGLLKVIDDPIDFK